MYNLNELLPNVLNENLVLNPLFLLIMGIIVVMSMIIFYVTADWCFKIESLLFGFSMGLVLSMLFISVYGLCVNIYISNNISYTTKEYTYDVELLPNNVMNNDSYSFIVDDKELVTTKTEHTIYKQDSKDKPYIKVTKLQLKLPKHIFIQQEIIDNVMNHEDVKNLYVLSELHY